MSQEEDQMLIELQELAKYLSIKLNIPLRDNPMDLNFATNCLNTILVTLNSNWQKIISQPKSQQQFQQAWVKIIKIAEQSFLEQEERILDQEGTVGIQNIIMLYEVLCQASQALQQQNLAPVLGPKNIQKNEIINKNNSDSNNNKPQGHKSKPKKQIKQTKQRPQTAVKNKNKIGEIKKLQQQVIKSVTKTMQKKYLVKAQAKWDAKIRQKEGTQGVQKAKRTLDYAIKDYEYESKQNALKKQKMIKKKQVNDPYMKMIQNKHKKLNEDLQNQQLKYYLELRDKKVAYIQHIHKLIQKLQKQREIQFHKRQRQMQNQKKKQLKQKIENVDNLFKTNMEKLQENYQKKKIIQRLQNIGQIEVCRAMQKTIKQKKIKQMDDMKNVWAEQRKQLHKITTDQQKMKNKLIQIYRKYRV